MMAVMGHLQVAHVDFFLSDGRQLLNGVNFRVGRGSETALDRPERNGQDHAAADHLRGHQRRRGTVTTSGGLGVMRQFVGQVRDESTVRDLLLSVAPPAVAAAGRRSTRPSWR